MRHVEICRRYGRAEGLVSTPASFLEYLSNHTSHPDGILKKMPFLLIGLLRRLDVEGDFQGQGFGKDLLERFCCHAANYGAHAVLLISDQNEVQRQGFSLDDFYKKNQFRKIAKTGSGSVMLRILI